jgi:hypothetical protein
MTNFVPDQLVKWTERVSKDAAIDPKKLKSLAFGNLSAKRSGKLCVVTAHLDSWEEGFTDIRRFVACDEGECDARLQVAGQKMFCRICRDKFYAVPKPFGELGAAAAATWPHKEWIDRSSISTEKAGEHPIALQVLARALCVLTNIARLQLRCVGQSTRPPPCRRCCSCEHVPRHPRLATQSQSILIPASFPISRTTAASCSDYQDSSSSRHLDCPLFSSVWSKPSSGTLFTWPANGMVDAAPVLPFAFILCICLQVAQRAKFNLPHLLHLF